MKIIILSKGHECFVDDEDYDELMKNKWSSNCKRNKNVYAQRSQRRGPRSEGKQGAIEMQRQIMNFPKGKVVDHINGNTLDNRKCNLRICDRNQNAMNNSGKRFKKYPTKYKGIKWDKSRNKWAVSIQVNKKTKYIGRYDSDIEAAKAYNEAAIKFYKEFANLNKIG